MNVSELIHEALSQPKELIAYWVSWQLALLFPEHGILEASPESGFDLEAFAAGNGCLATPNGCSLPRNNQLEQS